MKIFVKKNEKMKKTRNKKKGKNMEKNNETRKKNEEIWIHTQNPRRLPGFTVVVATFFVKILYDFHDFVSECVSISRGKSTSRFGRSRFSEEK